MVCQRCISSVEQLFQALKLPYSRVLMGEVELKKSLSDPEKKRLTEGLQRLGFELIDTRKNQLIEFTKKEIRAYLFNIEQSPGLRSNLSSFLTERIPYEYSYLSDLFSSVEGKTIETYFIQLRIERAKEWMVYQDKNLTEIADLLGFSSLHHLSAQFKKHTGLTPSHFKKIGASKRKGF
jgi:AraC family transcriptional regulator